jgi:hypothetical protein
LTIKTRGALMVSFTF